MIRQPEHVEIHLGPVRVTTRLGWAAVCCAATMAGCASYHPLPQPPVSGAAAYLESTAPPNASANRVSSGAPHATPNGANPTAGSAATGQPVPWPSAVIRGQSAQDPNLPRWSFDDDHGQPMPVSGQPQPGNGPTTVYQPPAGNSPPVPTGPDGLPAWQTAPPPVVSPFVAPPVGEVPGLPPPVGTPADIDVMLQEARTGRFIFGVGVNSEAGVTGQIIVDERNFDLFRLPTSWQDVVNGTAWRGAGQAFRIEAVPGDQVQRYLVSFTEPYLFGSQVGLNLSGYLFDRGYTDWAEQRLGGRVGVSYLLTPDLSVGATMRGEQVKVYQPRVLGLPALDEVIGNNDLYSARFTIRHDTRDIPFAPTEGHLIEASYEQTFGSFDYPRGEVDYHKHFLVRERPDGSGRHTLSFLLGAGFSGAQTPLFENFFAGGFSTLRGFHFRGASPVESGVIVGGRFQFLGSVEYMLPLTADDMIKGVAFCDYGTVEQNVEFVSGNFRVSPGIGLRISIPALGPAPLAFDLAFPVAHAPTDNIQNFSFFIGFGRG